MILDIDKMNDILLSGLTDIRIESFNDSCWYHILKIYDGHASNIEHPAIKMIFEEMWKNSKSDNPKYNFQNYRCIDCIKKHKLI